MSKSISRGTEGAFFGNTLGFSIGTLLTGVTLALPGINIVVAPLVVAAVAGTATVSCSAVGTLIGGVGGAISGAAEDVKERRENSDKQKGGKSE